MSVGFEPNSSLPNPLERFAKPDSWNSYISATANPKNILENGFTEVGLFTKIIETIKEAFGRESSTSSKALGNRLIEVMDFLETNKTPVTEQHLTTIITVATRAKVFGNQDEKKNYKPLTDRITALNVEVKKLQDVIIPEANETPEDEETLDLFTSQDNSSEDSAETSELPVVVDSTNTEVDPVKTDDVAPKPKKVKTKRTKTTQSTTSSSSMMTKAVKLASVAVITAGAVMAASRWSPLAGSSAASSTALVPVRETCLVNQCDLDEPAKVAQAAKAAKAAKEFSLPEDDPTYANPKFQMMSDTFATERYTGAGSVWNWASYNIQHQVVEPFEELLYPESCSPEYSGSEATMMADHWGHELFTTGSNVDTASKAKTEFLDTRFGQMTKAAANGISVLLEHAGNKEIAKVNAVHNGAAAIGNVASAIKDAPKVYKYFAGDIDKSIHKAITGFAAHVQPKGVVFAGENRLEYNEEAEKIALKGAKAVRKNPLNVREQAIGACEERKALKSKTRDQGTLHARQFAQFMDWMRHGNIEGPSCEKLWTECEQATDSVKQAAHLLVAKSGRPNKTINGLSQVVDWLDYSIEFARQNTASARSGFANLCEESAKAVTENAKKGSNYLYETSAQKLNEVSQQVVKLLLNGPRNSVV